MGHDDPLMMGMFWGGLLVASVPILLTLGIGIYVLKRYLEGRGDHSRNGSFPPDPADPVGRSPGRQGRG